MDHIYDIPTPEKMSDIFWGVQNQLTLVLSWHQSDNFLCPCYILNGLTDYNLTCRYTSFGKASELFGIMIDTDQKFLSAPSALMMVTLRSRS